MGYSVSVSFGTDEEKQKAKDFLTSNLNQDILGMHSTWTHVNAVDGSDLKYPPKENLGFILGFNGGTDNMLVYDICAFLSLRSSVRNNEGRPVVFYDEEEIPIFVGGLTQGEVCVDEQGVRLRRQKTLSEKMGQMFLGQEQNKIDEVLTAFASRWPVLSTPNRTKNPASF